MLVYATKYRCIHRMSKVPYQQPVVLSLQLEQLVFVAAALHWVMRAESILRPEFGDT